jgi:acetyl-CoA acetyltransferase
MTGIVIAAAARTPVGSFNGALAGLPAHQLGTVAIKAALERAGIAPAEVDEVILGQILTANTGQTPARQASVAAGIPVEHTAFGINQLCGSGLRAVALAMVIEARLRGRDVVRVELALRGVAGWVACWAAVDGDGLTVGCEGED